MVVLFALMKIKCLVTREASGTDSGDNDDNGDHHRPQEDKGRSTAISMIVGMLNATPSQHLGPIPSNLLPGILEGYPTEGSFVSLLSPRYSLKKRSKLKMAFSRLEH